MYVRFVIGLPHEGSNQPAGVLDAAYGQLYNQETPKHQVAELRRALEWFEYNLRAPNRFNKSKSKGFYRRPGKAICWFKDSALEHIAKVRELVAILEDNDIAVHMIKTRNPGYIVYEDEYQVAAEPFNDTPTSGT